MSRYELDSFKIVISQKTIVYWSIGTEGNNEKKKDNIQIFSYRYKYIYIYILTTYIPTTLM